MKRVLLAALLLIGCARAASAQPPRIEVRTAFGASNYLHGDIEYVAPTVIVAARVGRDRFAIEPEVGLAWHSATETYPGAAFANPVAVEQSHRFQSVAVNAIARGRGRRVSPYFGGGMGLYSERRRSTIGGQGEPRTFGPRPGTQIIGGIDVRVAPRVRMFGQGRYEMRSFSDPGGGSVTQGFVGVALALR